MKKMLQITALVAVGLTLPLSAAAQSRDVGNNDYTDADAGSLGVSANPNAGWCEADAGSLGLSDPVAACQN